MEKEQCKKFCEFMYMDGDEKRRCAVRYDQKGQEVYLSENQLCCAEYAGERGIDWEDSMEQQSDISELIKSVGEIL